MSHLSPLAFHLSPFASLRCPYALLVRRDETAHGPCFRLYRFSECFGRGVLASSVQVGSVVVSCSSCPSSTQVERALIQYGSFHITFDIPRYRKVVRLLTRIGPLQIVQNLERARSTNLPLRMKLVLIVGNRYWYLVLVLVLVLCWYSTGTVTKI